MKDGERRLAYAAVNAINNAAKEVQTAEQAHVRSKFVIRKPTFFFGTPGRPGGVAARISPFANVKKARPFAEVSISASTVAGERRLLLPIFEHGGEKRPTTERAKNVAIPITGRAARPSFRQGVAPQFTFAGMNLVAFRGKRRLRRATTRSKGVSLFGEFGQLALPQPAGALQWKGRWRTFLLTHAKNAPHGGVFQRFGPGRGDIKMLWAFEPKVPLPDRLDWLAVAERTARIWLPEMLEREVIKAIAHARGIGL